jgi:hypothetical protein
VTLTPPQKQLGHSKPSDAALPRTVPPLPLPKPKFGAGPRCQHGDCVKLCCSWRHTSAGAVSGSWRWATSNDAGDGSRGVALPRCECRGCDHRRCCRCYPATCAAAEAGSAGSHADVQQALRTLWCLSHNSKNAVAISTAGAVPLLVQLLKPGFPSGVQLSAAETLGHIAFANAEDAITIAAAGAVSPLAQLMRRSDDETKYVAADALEYIRRGIAKNRAAAAAAKASAAVVQEMDSLGVDGPSDMQTS